MTVPRIKSLLLLGDSLVRGSFSLDGGWGALLADRLTLRYDIKVRGFNGYNTAMLRQTLELLDKDIRDADIIVLCIGTNDSHVKEMSEKQHVPLHKFKVLLRSIILRLKADRDNPPDVILIPPLPSNDEDWKKALGQKWGKKLEEYPKMCCLTRQYYEASLQLAADTNCDAITPWNDFMDSDSNTGRSELFVDGLHFSSKGSQIVFQHLWQKIDSRTRHEVACFKEWRNFDLVD